MCPPMIKTFTVSTGGHARQHFSHIQHPQSNNTVCQKTQNNHMKNQSQTNNKSASCTLPTYQFCQELHGISMYFFS